MYNKVECIVLTCDNCQEQYQNDHSGFSIFVDEAGANDYADYEGWHLVNKHYCPKCFKITDDDKIIVDKTRYESASIQPDTPDEILKKQTISYYRKEFPADVSDEDLYKKVRFQTGECKIIIQSMEEYFNRFITTSHDNQKRLIVTLEQICKEYEKDKLGDGIISEAKDILRSLSLPSESFTREQMENIKAGVAQLLESFMIDVRNRNTTSSGRVGILQTCKENIVKLILNSLTNKQQ